MSRRAAFFLVLLTGCDFIEVKSADETSSSDTSYTSSTEGGDDDFDSDCDVSRDPVAVGGPDCVTEALSCGDRIASTTAGGDQIIDGPALQSWFCTIAGDSDYLGPERVYSFVHPGDSSEVTVSLSEPCGGLELFVMSWQDEDACPVDGEGVLQCDEAQGSGEVKIWDNEPRRYLVIVDGADEGGIPFSVGLECP